MINKNTPQPYTVNEPNYLRVGKDFAGWFLTSKKKRAWKAINALKVELMRVYNEKLDQEILNKKFLWWQQELERLCNNQARHPLTQATAQNATEFLDTFDDYKVLLSNWSSLISTPSYEWMSQNDLVKFCELSTGGFELLTSQVLLEDKPLHQLKEFILHTNEANIRINILRDFGLYLRSTRLPVPLSQLNSLGLVSQEVLNWRNEKDAPGWHKLATDMALVCRDCLQKAQQWIAPIPTREKQSQWITHAMSRVDMAILDEIEKSNFQVLSQRIELTPARSIGIIIKSKLLQ